MIDVAMTLSCTRYALMMSGRADDQIISAMADTIVNALLISLRTETSINTDVYCDMDACRGMIRVDCGPAEADTSMARKMFEVAACGLDALSYKFPDEVQFMCTKSKCNES